MITAILALRPSYRSGTRTPCPALELAQLAPQRSPARFTRLTSHWRRDHDGRLSRRWSIDPSWPGEPGAGDEGSRAPASPAQPSRALGHLPPGVSS
jgi:hypothetical protein